MNFQMFVGDLDDRESVVVVVVGVVSSRSVWWWGDPLALAFISSSSWLDGWLYAYQAVSRVPAREW